MFEFWDFRQHRRQPATGESVSWKINAERVVVLGWTAAMLMEFAHPLVAAGVTDHSVMVETPRQRMRRMRRTVEAMLALTFGTPRQAARAGHGINKIHDRVLGRLRTTTGIFAAGTPYTAHDPALLLWVHATLLYALPRAYELYVGPLTSEQKDRFCAEGVGMTAVLGIPEQLMPSSGSALHTYLDAMMASGAITVGEDARALKREMFAPPLGMLIYIPTVGLLPPAFRGAYGLTWSARHEAALRVSGWISRRLLPFVPPAWRFWPAARISMQSPGAGRIHTPSNPKLTAMILQELRHDHVGHSKPRAS